MSESDISMDDARPDGLAELLGIGLDEEAPASPKRRKADDLLVRLASTAGPDFGLAPAVSEAETAHAAEPADLADQPLSDLLLDGAAGLDILRRIKEQAKQASRAATGNAARRDVARTVYFAAIASALVHHGCKISRYGHGELGKTFAKLAALEWMAPELAEHFERAQAATETAAEGTDG